MKTSHIFQIVCIGISAFCSIAFSQDNYEKSISEVARAIIVSLHELKQLEGKHLAILGFRNEQSANRCKRLSSAIADHVSTSILEYQHFVNFQLAARKNLEAIEDEILISNGSMTGTIMDYLPEADILITGTWRSGKQYTYLTIKALEIAKKGTVELVSKQIQMDKHSLSEYFSDCFESKPDLPVFLQEAILQW